MDVKTGSSELHHILERQIALHRNLVDLLREEYAHMGAADVKGITESAHTKEVLLSQIWDLEQLRIKSTEKLALMLGLPATEATLSRLSESISGADGERLRTVRGVLNMMVLQARELNQKNMELAQGSLGRIEEMKRNVLGLNSGASKENYSNSGARHPVAEQGGRLLSTEA